MMTEDSTITSTPPGSVTPKAHRSIFKNIFHHHHDPELLSAGSSTTLYDDASSEEEKGIDRNSYSAALSPVCFKLSKDCRNTKKNQDADHLAENLQILDDEDYEKYLIQPKYIKTLKRCSSSVSVSKRLFLAQELHQGGKESQLPNGLLGSEGESSANAERNDGNAGSQKSCTDGSEHAIWTMKFSIDGKYLATAGKDGVIKIWKVICSPLDRLDYDAPPTVENNFDQRSENEDKKTMFASVFQQTPFRVYEGHTHDILSLDWSKNNFLISSSMDKTVKLWNINEKACLRTFTHSDFVTSVKFHPADDRFFLSGCLDHKVRLWSILDNEVSYEFDAQNLVTSVTFSPNGKLTIAGTFNGIIYFLDTTNLELRHSFELSQKRSNHRGSKITGIETFTDGDDVKVLVTSNDSIIRLISLKQRQLISYFKGSANQFSQIVATVSDDKKYIISGSEDHWVYIWNTKKNDKTATTSTGNASHLKKILLEKKKKRKDYTAFHAHHSIVTAALIAPVATSKLLSLSNDYIYEVNSELSQYDEKARAYDDYDSSLIKKDFIGGIIISSDETGVIRVFRQDFDKDVRKLLLSERDKKKKLQEATPEHRVILNKRLNRSNDSFLNRGNSFRLGNSNHAHTSDGSSASLNGHSTKSWKDTIDSSNGGKPQSLPQRVDGTNNLVCDVCNNHDKFTFSRSGPDGHMSFFCADCGTEINS